MSSPATLPRTVTDTIEAALNRYLHLDPELPEKLAPLNGRVIAIELRGLGIVFYVQPSGDRLRVMNICDTAPDTVLSGTPLTMARLGLSSDSKELLFGGGVTIEGDAELGQRFKELLDSIDIDWEEQLSHITGDIIAHQIGVAWRDLQAWRREATETLLRDATEYFQEETRDLPTRAEIDVFLREVDALRSDVDRMEQRVARLKPRESA